MEDVEDDVVRKEGEKEKEEESTLLMKNTCFVPSCQLHLVASWAGRE